MKKLNVGGFVVFAEADGDLVPEVPTWCPVCAHEMRNDDDVHAHKGYGACNLCASRWARHDPERWSSGWRPDKNEMDIEMLRRSERHT